jgi:hypothetical protein
MERAYELSDLYAKRRPMTTEALDSLRQAREFIADGLKKKQKAVKEDQKVLEQIDAMIIHLGSEKKPRAVSTARARRQEPQQQAAAGRRPGRRLSENEKEAISHRMKLFWKKKRGEI